MLAQGSMLGLWANIDATVGEGEVSGQAQQELVARTTASFQRTQPNEMFLEQKPWKCHRVILGVLGLGQAKHPVVLTQWTLSGQTHCHSIPDLALLSPHSDILPPDPSYEPAFLSSFTMSPLLLTTSPWLLPIALPCLVLLLPGNPGLHRPHLCGGWLSALALSSQHPVIYSCSLCGGTWFSPAMLVPGIQLV